MKILLLGTPRSGTTSLTKLIGSHLSTSNYGIFIEPFNKSLYETHKSRGFNFKTIDPLLNYDNLLVKTLFLVGNDEYPESSFDSFFSYLDWCVSFFDKIIIIDRVDKIAQSESFVVNETMMRECGIDWHTPKVYNLEKISKEYIDIMFERYIQSSEILHKIGVKNNIPIFYYEDLFVKHDVNTVQKLFDYIEIKMVENHYKKYILSPERKTRIEPQKNKLI